MRQKPEEAVRKQCLEAMVGQLGYPQHLLSVERTLRHLPHLRETPRLPSRRIDLLCWTGGGASLHPLLLVECKAGPIQWRGLRQAIHYNTFVGAPFISVVSDQGVWLMRLSDAEVHRSEQLPSYHQLLTWLRGDL
jgi:hypothetical protein